MKWPLKWCTVFVCQVSGLSQRVAELEGQLDRALRDKSSLTSQLEDTLRTLTSQEQENTKVSDAVCARKLCVSMSSYFLLMA